MAQRLPVSALVDNHRDGDCGGRHYSRAAGPSSVREATHWDRKRCSACTSCCANDGIDVLLFGLGRFGSTIADRLREQGCRIQAIDFDPNVMRLHERAGYQARYGDAEDPEPIGTLPLDNATLVVSTLRDRILTRALLQGLKQQGYHGKVAVSTSTLQEAEEFHRQGADLVLVPYADAAKEAADKLVRACRQCTVSHDSGVAT